MVDVNLLPTGVKPKASVLKLSKTLKKIFMIEIAAFVSVGLGVLGVSLFLGNRIDVVSREADGLKNQITSLEQTEQRFFLLKERLEKIGQIGEKENVDEGLVILADFLNKKDAAVVLIEAELSKGSALITANIPNSTILTRLIEELDDESFKLFEISSLEYISEGYYTEFVLTR